MTVPTATHTRTPTSVTLTLAAPIATVTLDDTTSATPPVTSRSWKADTVAIAGATADPQTIYVFGAGDGTIDIVVNAVNADGNDDSTADAITVTDNVATDVSTLVTANGNGRLYPAQMPPEYRDPTVATPGMPTAKKVYQARRWGSVLPADITPNVGI